MQYSLNVIHVSLSNGYYVRKLFNVVKRNRKRIFNAERRGLSLIPLSVVVSQTDFNAVFFHFDNRFGRFDNIAAIWELSDIWYIKRTV